MTLTRFRFPREPSNQRVAADRRHAEQSDDPDDLSVTLAANRAFPAAFAELGR
jgi:hypothetical protein